MISRSRGGIGRRVGFRFRWETVGVQIPSTAPAQLPTKVGGFSLPRRAFLPVADAIGSSRNDRYSVASLLTNPFDCTSAPPTKVGGFSLPRRAFLPVADAIGSSRNDRYSVLLCTPYKSLRLHQRNPRQKSGVSLCREGLSSLWLTRSALRATIAIPSLRSLQVPSTAPAQLPTKVGSFSLCSSYQLNWRLSHKQTRDEGKIFVSVLPYRITFLTRFAAHRRCV